MKRYLITYSEYMGDMANFSEVEATNIKELLTDVLLDTYDPSQTLKELINDFDMNNGDGMPYVIVYEIGKTIKKVIG